MNYANYDDIVNQLRAAGLVLNTVKKTHGGVSFGELCVGSTKSVRCDVDGEKKRQTGAYWLHELRLNDGIWITGSYWVDHGNASFKLELNKECSACGAIIPLKGSSCSCGSKKIRAREIPPEQLEAHKMRMAEAKKQAEAERAAEIEKASRWATSVWRACRQAVPGDHDYLERKQIEQLGGIRILESNEGIKLDGDEEDVAAAYKYLATFHGALAIPACDQNGKVFGLQFILSREKHKDAIRRMERDKAYWPSGMAVEGHYWLIGNSPASLTLVAEGWATGQTLHEATGIPVAVAFAANNLAPVAENLRSHYKRANLLIGADDDRVQRCDQKTGGCGKYTPVEQPNCIHCGHAHGKKNPGVEAAAQTALKVKNTAWLKPEFAEPRPNDKKGDTDFNDLRVREGIQSVRAQVEAKIKALEWRLPTPLASSSGGDAPQGGRGKRKAAQSVMLLDEAIMRFIPIDDGTGKTLFDTWTNKLSLKDAMASVLPAGVRWDDIKRDPMWVQRGAYYLDQVGFDPTGKDKNCQLNTWQGWPMEPRQGRCDILLDLIEYLCSEDDNRKEVVKWLLRWMAYPLQHPGAKMSSAVIMHGPQGTGKSTIFQTLAKIYGDYSTVLNQRGLEDKFNSDWSDSKLFILAEEVVTRAEMWHIKNELKELVTGEWIRINPKNIAAYRQRNQLNIVYLSNDDQPLPIENDDRRHLVVWTPPQLSEEFFDELYRELENGGVAAFYHHLLNIDLGDFHPKKRPPMTEAKKKLITLSNSNEREFVVQYLAGELEVPVCPCRINDLFDMYTHWVRVTGEPRARSLRQFSQMMSRMPGWENKRVKVLLDGSLKTATIYIPPGEVMSKNGTAKQDCDSETKWLGESATKFLNAVSDVKS